MVSDLDIYRSAKLLIEQAGSIRHNRLPLQGRLIIAPIETPFDSLS